MNFVWMNHHVKTFNHTVELNAHNPNLQANIGNGFRRMFLIQCHGTPSLKILSSVVWGACALGVASIFFLLVNLYHAAGLKKEHNSAKAG